ncbi:MAG: hypothetical protein ACOYJO_02605 [Eubacterium sp.]
MKMRESKTVKRVGSLLAVFLAFCLFFSSAQVASYAGGSQASNVTMTVSGNVEVETGVDHTFNTTVTVSGTDGLLPAGSYLMITMPTTYLDQSNNGGNGLNAQPEEAVRQSLQSDPEITWDDTSNTASVKYTFKELTGNSTVTLPAQFKTLTETTPPGSSFDVSVVLYDPDGTEVSRGSFTVTNKADYALITKDYYLTAYETMTNGRTSSDESALSVQALTYFLNMVTAGDHGDTGYFFSQHGKIVINFTTDDVLYSDSYGKGQYTNASMGWTYDAASRTVSCVINDNYRYLSSKYLYLKFKDFEANKSVNFATVYYVELDDQGNEIPESKTNVSDLTVKPTDKIWHSLDTEDTHKNYARPNSRDYPWIEANKDRETTWGIALVNESTYGVVGDDGLLQDGSDPNLYLKEFVLGNYNYTNLNESYYLDPHLYFTSVEICDEHTYDSDDIRAALGSNKVYAIDSSGNETLIKENLQVGEELTVPEDKRETYRAFRFEFTDRVKLPFNERICFTYKTKVFSDDYENGRQSGTQWHMGNFEDKPLLNTNLSVPEFVHYYFAPESGADDREGEIYTSQAVQIISGGILTTNCSTDRSTVLEGQTSNITIMPYSAITMQSIAPEETEAGTTTLVDPQVYVVLPDGWVSGGEAKVTYYYHGDNIEDALDVETVDDFMGTGKKALRVSGFPNFEFGYTNIIIPVKPLTSAAVGTSDFPIYIAYTNNGEYQVTPEEALAVTDTYDLNGNGSTEDLVLGDSIKISYKTPSEEIDPNEPTNPTNPTEPTDTENPTTPADTGTDNAGSTAPATGDAEDMLPFAALAISCAGAAAVIGLRRRAAAKISPNKPINR